MSNSLSVRTHRHKDRRVPLIYRLHLGGDGPMIIELEQMREKYQGLLGERVQLLGSIGHEQVRDVGFTVSINGLHRC